jgi:hypothetical protein
LEGRASPQGHTSYPTHVIPLFLAHPLEGAKKKDFEDFLRVAELIKTKAHLKKEGLEQIRLIKSGMNSNRDSSSE